MLQLNGDFKVDFMAMKSLKGRLLNVSDNSCFGPKNQLNLGKYKKIYPKRAENANNWKVLTF
ncbi:hypothetical protein [Flavobacterium degerlachei]|uniref:Uncharacterized protein n=1 Tax=Flavobacterium degerlachei TaxID=229203 RepID=A0A1H2UMD6_9FLAO|nr:hypothetical protein [Flavobacterium degerlachei]SDW57323.1 hypothetical protein SAMN05444338_103210 [Flavobacterium degerlachei]